MRNCPESNSSRPPQIQIQRQVVHIRPAKATPWNLEYGNQRPIQDNQGHERDSDIEEEGDPYNREALSFDAWVRSFCWILATSFWIWDGSQQKAIRF